MSLLTQAYRDVAEASVVLPDFFLLLVIFSNNKKILWKSFLFHCLGSWYLVTMPSQHPYFHSLTRTTERLKERTGRIHFCSFLGSSLQEMWEWTHANQTCGSASSSSQSRPMQVFFRKELFSSANPLRRLWFEYWRSYIFSVPLRCLCSLPNRYSGESWGEVNRRDKDPKAQSLFVWCLFKCRTTKLY